MLVYFSCPRCGKKLKADPARVGKKAACRRCGERLEVPGEPASPPGPASAREPAGSIVSHDSDSDLHVEEPQNGSVGGAVPPAGNSGSVSAPPPAKAGVTEDHSAGLASMYLGGINLILFLASQTLGGSLITLIGWTFGLALQVAVCVVCLSVAWVGWRLAQEARVQAALQHGRGSAYATAARTVHGLFGLLNIGLLVAFLAAFVSGSSRGALPGGSGLPDVGNLLKPLMELHKEQNKLLEGLK